MPTYPREHFTTAQGARNYAAKFETQWVERVRNSREEQLVSRLLARIPAADLTGSILDMPCGTGRFSPLLRQYAQEVIAADCSASMLQTGKSRNGATVLGFLRVFATELPFSNESFDLVFSVRLSHHLPTAEERTRYIREVLRVSRKWVVLTYLDTRSPHHVARSAMRRVKGKQPKKGMDRIDFYRAVSGQGFDIVESMLLSRLFSGQRYTVLKRAA